MGGANVTFGDADTMGALTSAAILSAAAATMLIMSAPPARTRLARISAARTRLVRNGATAQASAHHARHSPTPAQTLLTSPRGQGAAALLAGVGSAVFIGGGFGIAAGVGIGVAAWFGLRRLEPSSQTREREQVEAMLPLVADLLTAALGAGCPPVQAAEHVGNALDGPLGRTLVAAASSARFGSDPERGWAPLTSDPVLRPLGRALVSATARGTSPVPALERAAQDAREAARWAAESRARSLGTRAAAPLGLCFLPAFVLLGIVPIVVSSGVVLP